MKKYYKYYFEQLAIRDQQILHDPNGQTAYYFVKDKYDLESFDNAIKSVGKTPALLLENYYSDLEDGSARNYFKHLTGRFSILTKTTVGDQSSIDDAQTLCESIAEDLIAKMREDLQEGAHIVIAEGDQSNKVFFNIRSVKLDFVGPMSTNYYGVTVSFTFKTSFNAIKNAANWV